MFIPAAVIAAALTLPPEKREEYISSYKGNSGAHNRYMQRISRPHGRPNARIGVPVRTELTNIRWMGAAQKRRRLLGERVFV